MSTAHDLLQIFRVKGSSKHCIHLRKKRLPHRLPFEASVFRHLRQAAQGTGGSFTRRLHGDASMVLPSAAYHIPARQMGVQTGRAA